MQTPSDARLLRDYAEHGRESAFAELTARHTNLVYSAALRQVESPDVAAEVAQQAFIGLARGAQNLSRKLADDASLAGWLCRSARNLALNLRRDEFRRHSRERQAMAHHDPTPESAPDWEQMRPVLDEAMAELNEPDYDALVMRFYQNQDLRSVGSALGLSDDAAQKRVARALDKLRELLTRRGVTTRAAALSIVLSANAVQAAPVGLAVTITTAAALGGTTIASTATATAIKTIAMTTLQKTIIGATLAAAVGSGIYETRQASRLREQVQTLQQQQAALTDRIPQLQRERDEAKSRLALLAEANESGNRNPAELLKLRGEVGVLRRDSQELAQLKAASSTNDAADTELRAWYDRVRQLRQRLAENPSWRIPELRLLSEQDWLDVARKTRKPETQPDPEFRIAVSWLRSRAERTFAPMAQEALKKYAAANNGDFPTDLAQLKPYFEGAVDDAILQRYTIAPRETAPFKNWTRLGKGNWVVTQRALADEKYDRPLAITPHFWSDGTGPAALQPSPQPKQSL